MTLFAPRLCTDCRYAIGVTGAATHEAWYCQHESSVWLPPLHLVTGEVPAPSRLTCAQARGAAGITCGAAGRFFEATPTLEARSP